MSVLVYLGLFIDCLGHVMLRCVKSIFCENCNLFFNAFGFTFHSFLYLNFYAIFLIRQNMKTVFILVVLVVF